MNKQDIIDALNAQGVTFDPTQSKGDLAALLGNTVGKPGDEAGKTDTTGAPPAGEPEKPAADKPAEAPPADVNFVPPGEQAPVPVLPQADKPADDKPAESVAGTTAPPVDIAAADAAAARLHSGADLSQASTAPFVEFLAERETLPFPSPFPKLIPDEEWDADYQAQFEAALAEKIAAGLSKEQALEVIERQIDWDLYGDS